MSEIVDITTLAELDKAIAENDSVVVLFHAPAWCAPCRKFHPHFEEAAGRVDAKFVQVDIDTAERGIADRYSVMSVPTVKLLRGSEIVNIESRTLIPLVKELNA